MRQPIAAAWATLAAFFVLVESALAKSDAYNAGYVVGRIVFIVLILALVIWAVRALFMRSRSDS